MSGKNRGSGQQKPNTVLDPQMKHKTLTANISGTM